MEVGGPCSISGCRRSTMYGSSKCYKHRDLGIHDDPSIEQIQAHSVSQNKTGSQILFNIDGNDFSMPSKNIDGVIDKISKGKLFWTVDLGLDSNEFIQYAIDDEKLEHWGDSKMLESTEMGHERALLTLKEKIMDPNLTAGMWWKDDGQETKTEDTLRPVLNMIAIPVAIIFVLIFMENYDFYVPLDFSVELCCYGLMAIGGMGASMSRTKEGRFASR